MNCQEHNRSRKLKCVSVGVDALAVVRWEKRCYVYDGSKKNETCKRTQINDPAGDWISSTVYEIRNRETCKLFRQDGISFRSLVNDANWKANVADANETHAWTNRESVTNDCFDPVHGKDCSIYIFSANTNWDIAS